MITRRRFLRVCAGVAVSGAGLLLYTFEVEPHWLELVRRPLAHHEPAVRPAGQDAGPHQRRARRRPRRRQLRPRHVRPRQGALAGHRRLHRRLHQLSAGHVRARRADVRECAARAPRDLRDSRESRLRAWVEPARAGEAGWSIGSPRRESGSSGTKWARPGACRWRAPTSSGLHQFDLRRTLDGLDPARPAIVLSHNPDTVDLTGWDGYRGWIISGHTHGGQCKPPFLPPPILPVRNKRYTSGEFALSDDRRLYISRGVGHLRRVRFNVRPEVTVFALETT